jgi:hypothetical protein
MPAPNTGEKKDAFISRFMSSKKAQGDFPDKEQRLAVAHSMWSKRTNTGIGEALSA